MQRLAVLGAGSWGTALAVHFARAGHSVSMWGNNADHIDELSSKRCNDYYLPEVAFPELLSVTVDLENAIHDADVIVMAVPSSGFESVLTLLQPLLVGNAIPILCTAKGLLPDTHELLNDALKRLLGDDYPSAVLSGPSFAREVGKALPTAVVVASDDMALAEQLAEICRSDRFRVYTCDDVVGVEVGGVVKNMLAIATGISDGMGMGANSRSALIARGLIEMTRFGVALGAVEHTFLGLSGVGDLVLTCTDDQSRNRRLGLALGQGKTIAEAHQSIGQVTEGERATHQILSIAEEKGIRMPIAVQVGAVLSGSATPELALEHLLAVT